MMILVRISSSISQLIWLEKREQTFPGGKAERICCSAQYRHDLDLPIQSPAFCRLFLRYLTQQLSVCVVHLNLINILIDSLVGNQLLMSSDVRYLSFVSSTRIWSACISGGDAVGNQDDGRTAHLLLERLSDLRIGFCIHRRKRVVKDHHRRILRSASARWQHAASDRRRG